MLVSSAEKNKGLVDNPNFEINPVLALGLSNQTFFMQIHNTLLNIQHNQHNL